MDNQPNKSSIIENVFWEEKFVIKQTSEGQDEYDLTPMFQNKQIVPLDIIYDHAGIERLWEYNRIGRTLIQFSFLIMNEKNELMLYKRPKGKSGSAGHQITVDDKECSALISVLPKGDSACTSYHDILGHFHKKINSRAEKTTEKDISFVGVVKNTRHVTASDPNGQEISGSIQYIFYVFCVRYCCEGNPFKPNDEEPTLINSADIISKFVPIQAAYDQFNPNKHKAEIAAVKMLINPEEANLMPTCVVNNDKTPTTVFGKTIGTFIVHAKEDHQELAMLISVFEKHHIPYWIDDLSAHPYDSWKNNIRDVIHHASNIILLLGKNTLSPNNKHIQEELELIAQEIDIRPTLPIIVLTHEKFDNDFNNNPHYEKIRNRITTLTVIDPDKKLDEAIEKYFLQHLKKTWNNQ